MIHGANLPKQTHLASILQENTVNITTGTMGSKNTEQDAIKESNITCSKAEAHQSNFQRRPYGDSFPTSAVARSGKDIIVNSDKISGNDND